MKMIIYLISLLTLMTCVNERQLINRELKSDKLVSEFFNDKEIEELGKIILFFESQICEEVNEVNFKKCYKKFLKKDSIRLVDEHQLFMMDYEKQKKLYSSLGSIFLKSFFDKGIMDKLIGINPKKRIEYEYLNLKVYNSKSLSKYGSYIQELSKKNKFLKGYSENAKISNEFFAPTDQKRFIINYRNFNFNDIKIRLIYSMNHLIINERNRNTL